ncbi:MAG: NUDIX domain-containing protein [bacterium]|nr:NUDIX domain-containing protein [bacterium]
MSNIAVLVDDKGTIIGQKDRHELQAGDSVAITSLWIENSRCEVLLAQRSLQKRNQPGLWGPGATGTVEPDESFEDNIVKEAHEEIGLILKNYQELFRVHYIEGDGIGRYAVWFKTIVDLPLESFILQEGEVDEVRWISKDTLNRELSRNPNGFVTAQGLWQKLLTKT